ncbi:MAG: ACP S-malonyltransferase [Acidimicrobiia bacterium]|nr:ACP S-malonyltransferase [Acidimicrobiia bacterium]
MIAFVFPGQGSQNPGMGAPWVEAWPDLFDAASEAAGSDVVRLTCSADETELRRTDNAQIATAVCSLAALASLRAAGVTPAVTAGHSLGEYPALVAAGSLDDAAAISLVATRGSAMATAAARFPGTMAALLGADEHIAQAACDKAAAGGDPMVCVANHNAADQVVISGTEAGVDAAAAAAKELGAKKALPLRVGGAFHSPLMAPALVPLAVKVAATPFADATVPIVANLDATAHTDAAEIAPLLLGGLCAPVRWHETMQLLDRLGVDAVVEVGQGGVLHKLAKRALPGRVVARVAEPADAATVADELGGI